MTWKDTSSGWLIYVWMNIPLVMSKTNVLMFFKFTANLRQKNQSKNKSVSVTIPWDPHPKSYDPGHWARLPVMQMNLISENILVSELSQRTSVKLSLIGHSPVSSFDYVNDSDKTGNNEILISKTKNVLNTKKMSNISVYFFSYFEDYYLYPFHYYSNKHQRIRALYIFWQSFRFDGWLVNRN